MIYSVFILDARHEVLIEKHYRGNAQRVECDKFRELLLNKGPSSVPPIVLTSKTSMLAHIRRNDLTLLALLKSDVPLVSVLEMLSQMADLLELYFGEFTEHAIKEHFVTVYELLDELIDNGYAMTTESNILMELLPPPNLLSKLFQKVGPEMASVVVSDTSSMKRDLPRGSLSMVPWRRQTAKYSQNEVFIDIEEQVNAIVADNGNLQHLCIVGNVKCTSYLSGMPDLCMYLSDSGMIDDASLHPCVRYARYERDKVVSFIPPDGPFQLMQYIIRSASMPLPVDVRPSIKFSAHDRSGEVRIIFAPVLMSAQTENSEDCSVTVPFPVQVVSVSLSTDVGTIMFNPDTHICVWHIGNLKRGRNAILQGTITLDPKLPCPESTPPVQAAFRLPLVSASGMSVTKLDIYNEHYKPFKGLKCTTVAGKYEFRTC